MKNLTAVSIKHDGYPDISQAEDKISYNERRMDRSKNIDLEIGDSSHSIDASHAHWYIDWEGIERVCTVEQPTCEYHIQLLIDFHELMARIRKSSKYSQQHFKDATPDIHNHIAKEVDNLINERISKGHLNYSRMDPQSYSTTLQRAPPPNWNNAESLQGNDMKHSWLPRDYPEHIDLLGFQKLLDEEKQQQQHQQQKYNSNPLHPVDFTQQLDNTGAHLWRQDEEDIVYHHHHYQANHRLEENQCRVDEPNSNNAINQQMQNQQEHMQPFPVSPHESNVPASSYLENISKFSSSDNLTSFPTCHNSKNKEEESCKIIATERKTADLMDIPSASLDIDVLPTERVSCNVLSYKDDKMKLPNKIERTKQDSTDTELKNFTIFGYTNNDTENTMTLQRKLKEKPTRKKEVDTFNSYMDMKDQCEYKKVTEFKKGKTELRSIDKDVKVVIKRLDKSNDLMRQFKELGGVIETNEVEDHNGFVLGSSLVTVDVTKSDLQDTNGNISEGNLHRMADETTINSNSIGENIVHGEEFNKLTIRLTDCKGLLGKNNVLDHQQDGNESRTVLNNETIDIQKVSSKIAEATKKEDGNKSQIQNICSRNTIPTSSLVQISSESVLEEKDSAIIQNLESAKVVERSELSIEKESEVILTSKKVINVKINDIMKEKGDLFTIKRRIADIKKFRNKKINKAKKENSDVEESSNVVNETLQNCATNESISGKDCKFINEKKMGEWNESPNILQNTRDLCAPPEVCRLEKIEKKIQTEEKQEFEDGDEIKADGDDFQDHRQNVCINQLPFDEKDLKEMNEVVKPHIYEKVESHSNECDISVKLCKEDNALATAINGTNDIEPGTKIDSTNFTINSFYPCALFDVEGKISEVCNDVDRGKPVPSFSDEHTERNSLLISIPLKYLRLRSNTKDPYCNFLNRKRKSTERVHTSSCKRKKSIGKEVSNVKNACDADTFAKSKKNQQISSPLDGKLATPCTPVKPSVGQNDLSTTRVCYNSCSESDNNKLYKSKKSKRSAKTILDEERLKVKGTQHQTVPSRLIDRHNLPSYLDPRVKVCELQIALVGKMKDKCD